MAEAGEARVRPRSQRRHDLADHGEIVDRPGAVGEDHRGGVRLAEDVGHVLGAEARVDRYEHGADLHDGEHRVDPLGTVDHPERDLVPRRDAEGQESLRHRVDACVHLGERPASSLEGERLPRTPLAGRPLGQKSDRLLRVPVAHDGLASTSTCQAPVPRVPPSPCLRRKSSTSFISRSESSFPPGSGDCSSLTAASYSCSSFRTCSRVARSRATA